MQIRHLIKKTKPGDRIILAGIALLAGILFVLSLIPAGGADKLEVQVRINRELTAVLPLDRDAIYDAGSLTVVVENKTVRVEEAACPDKLCQWQGEISRPGQSITCLPARLTVTISGTPEVDAVSY